MKRFFIFIIFSSLTLNLQALDFNFWRHPEIAEKNSIFIDVGIPIYIKNPQFNFLPLEIRLEYMLPISLPVSIGLFFNTPDPNPTSFGLRIGYHLDFSDPLLDVYLLYHFNCGFLIRDILYHYNDKPAPNYLFDYRIGVRRYFGFFGLVIESGFHFESILIMVTFKLN